MSIYTTNIRDKITVFYGLPASDNQAGTTRNQLIHILTVNPARVRLELEKEIKRTDEPIDEIVYKLYRLTADEVEIVEPAVGS